MLKIYSSKVIDKKMRLLAGAMAGTFVFTLSSCGAKESEVEETTTSYTTTAETEQTYTVSIVDSEPFVTTSTTYDETPTVDSTISSDSLNDLKPVIINLKAEDIIEMSRGFAYYVDSKATLSHENYKFSTITPEDLYSVVYLANIDYVSKDETKRLIDAGIISDNINDNIANSFYFYELYADDTINKIASGNSDIMDISKILLNENDQKVAALMNKIMVDSITATSDVNYKNYIDTVFYYAEGTTLYNTDYDYSQSIYETDRDRLTVGGDYTLSYAASCIDEISKIKGVANKYASQVMYDGRVDFSNLANVFNGCKLPQQMEENKVLVK